MNSKGFLLSSEDELNKNQLEIINKTLPIKTEILTEEQKSILLRETPPQFIYTTQKRGGTYQYVSVGYIIALLNSALGIEGWEFEVLGERIEQGQCVVKGKLTLYSNGKSISRTNFGGSEIKKLKTGGLMSIGNDMKIATSDCLKKCASMFGIASDVFHKKEKDIMQKREKSLKAKFNQALKK